jgi:hypothetical protein
MDEKCGSRGKQQAASGGGVRPSICRDDDVSTEGQQLTAVNRGPNLPDSEARSA